MSNVIYIVPVKDLEPSWLPRDLRKERNHEVHLPCPMVPYKDSIIIPFRRSDK